MRQKIEGGGVWKESVDQRKRRGQMTKAQLPLNGGGDCSAQQGAQRRRQLADDMPVDRRQEDRRGGR